MRSHPYVTIGMPIYNGEQYLRYAIESLLAQTFEDFEIIISDNASIDRTEEICREYMARDQRIRYQRNEKNLGAAHNYNRLVELATGTYFKWASHDDVCAPTLIEKCVELLDHTPSAVLCYARTTIIDANGTPVKNHIDAFNFRSPRPNERFKSFLKISRGLMNPVFGLIRTATLRQTPIIGSYPSSDMILLAELALHGEFCEVPEYLFFRREHPKMSVVANRSFKERNLWFDTAYKGHGQFTRWRWFFEYLAAIHRVPIGWNEKFLCYLHMSRWLKRTRRELMRDLTSAATHLLRSA